MLLGPDQEPTTVRQILGFVAVDLDYSWYEAVLMTRRAYPGPAGRQGRVGERRGAIDRRSVPRARPRVLFP